MAVAVRPLAREGLAVHATMREILNEVLQVRSSDRFRTLHERAGMYYKARLERSSGDERERYTLEYLYHMLCADEGNGLPRFQELAEELSRYRLANRLRALLNDVNTYPLAMENSRRWKEYYNARLVHLEAHFDEAEKVYRKIAENTQVEPILRAYALCDWGSILCRRERLRQPGGEEKAVRALESSLNMEVATDVKMAMSNGANPGQAVAGDFPNRLGCLALCEQPDDLPPSRAPLGLWPYGIASRLLRHSDVVARRLAFSYLQYIIGFDIIRLWQIGPSVLMGFGGRANML